MTEDSIRVVCRIRPLNKTESSTKSKFIVNFSQDDENCVSISVSFTLKLLFFVNKEHFKIKVIILTKF